MSDFSGDPFLGRVVQEGNEFKADDLFFKNVIAARAAYNKLKSNNAKRIFLQEQIEGLVKGNPPYDPAELEKAGLEHVTNFNDMSASGVIKRGCLAYWNLLYNSQNFVRFNLRIKDGRKNEYASIMANNWDYVVKNYWPSFNINIATLSTQLVKFGISPVLFPDEKSPFWNVVELHRFYIPDETQSDLDLLTTVFVETDFTVQDLYQTYLKIKDIPTKKTPWNAEQIGKLLVFLTSTLVKDSTSNVDLFELERKFLNGDVSFENIYSDKIKLISVFQKDYDGKISHYMFHRYFQGGTQFSDTEDFIFFEKGQYTKMSEGVIIFTMNPGAFTIHSNQGLGHEIFSLSQAKIQLNCSVVDMAKWSSTPIIKSSALGTKDVEQIQFYPGVPTNIGSNEFLQNNLGANVGGVVSAGQYLSSLLQFNITYSGSDPSIPDPDQGSYAPSQARLLAIREFSVAKNNVMHFYGTLDVLVRNMVSRMLRVRSPHPAHPFAKAWIDRCIEDGVPPEIFDFKDADLDPLGMPKWIEVYATRAAGAGSQVAHLVGLQELQAIAGSFGPKEEEAFKKQFVMATIGPEYVDTFVQDTGGADERAGGASLAGVENAIMQAGKSPIFSPDNEHRAHIPIHMALCSSIIQQIQQQQMTAVEADSIFSVVIPHLQEHMQAVATNPFTQSFFEQVKPSVEQVIKFASLNRRNAAKQAQAQLKQQRQQEEEQSRVMTEEELKAFQVERDEARKDEKQIRQSIRQDRAAQVKEKALERRVDADISNQTRKTQAEIEATKKKASDTVSPTSFFENTANQQMQASPGEYLRNMSGATPSPYDIEE